MFQLYEMGTQRAKIVVVGLGGAGGNAVNRMIDAGLTGVEFIVANTDLQALEGSRAPNKLPIGSNITHGLGSGGNPEVGRRAMEEDADRMAELIEGADMVFVTCGMGGGTGTGASPKVAEIARDLHALTVAIVTKPFEFEGTRRMRQAVEGIDELRERVDTLIVIPNQRLLAVVDKQTTIWEAFRMADDVLLHATRGISDLITVPGLINLDFADVRAVMSETGEALMGSGTGIGENRAAEAAQEAISCPLLEDTSIEGACGILVNITGGHDLSLHEVNDATSVITAQASAEANVIFGAVVDDATDGQVRVTVIATGLGHSRVSRLERKVESAEINSTRDPFEIPAFRRRERISEQALARNGKVSSFSPDDLDIPTFLRRQMD